MCSRFSLAEERDFLARRLHVSARALADYRPRYNIAPRQEHLIVTTEDKNRTLVRARWGLQGNSGEHGLKRYLINAKAETVETRSAFAEAFAQRRCVIPASGFYEWTGPKSARQPYWINRSNGDLLLFAGLYGNETDDDTSVSFTILTCAANSTLSAIHNRMPVILSDRDADDWMNPRAKAPRSLKRLLVAPAEDLLVAQAASPLVNSAANEGPQLLAGCRMEQQLLFGF
jgi:putative SOS response-associated peptidase YedK